MPAHEAPAPKAEKQPGPDPGGDGSGGGGTGPANTTLSLDENGQLEANKQRQMLSGGAYGNGAYRLETWSIVYDEAACLFTVQLKVVGNNSISNETKFTVRCLNGNAGEEGRST